MTNQKSFLEKPKNVILAIQLLWATIAVAVLSMALDWNQTLEKLNDQITHQFPGFPIKPELFIILIWGFTLAILIWLIIKITSGRNWARILYLIMTVIGLPFSIPELVDKFNTSMLTFFLAFLTTILSVAICVLLFMPSSNAWFKELKAQRKLKKS